jgi:hypothetical protein
MKHFQLVGGFCGFVLAFCSSISAGNEVAIALRDAAVGCLCGAILFRGFHSVLAWSVKNFAIERARARRVTEADKQIGAR